MSASCLTSSCFIKFLSRSQLLSSLIGRLPPKSAHGSTGPALSRRSSFDPSTSSGFRTNGESKGSQRAEHGALKINSFTVRSEPAEGRQVDCSTVFKRGGVELKMETEPTQKTQADLFHWERLSQLHPTDVCNRTEAIYNPAREGFILPVYHLRYLVIPKTRKILRWSGMIEPLRRSFSLLFI